MTIQILFIVGVLLVNLISVKTVAAAFSTHRDSMHSNNGVSPSYDVPITTVVVTGATGKVGSRLVRQLLSADYSFSKDEEDSQKKHDSSNQICVVALVRNVEKAKNMFSELYDDATLDCHKNENPLETPRKQPLLIIEEADYADETALDHVFSRISSSTTSSITSSSSQQQQQQSFRLFLTCGNVPSQADLELNVIQSAQKHGASFCVKLSTATPLLIGQSSSPSDEKDNPDSPHDVVENALMRQQQLPYAILRPNIFMQMFSSPGLFGVQWGKKKEVEVRGGGGGATSFVVGKHPLATSPISMIDCHDVAACAASILTCSDDDDVLQQQHGGKIYDLTGPESVKLSSYHDFPKLSQSTEASHTCVSSVDTKIDPCTVEEHIVACGLPKEARIKFQSFFDTIGKYDTVSNHVQLLTGKPPTSFRTYLQENPYQFDSPRK